MNFIWLNVDNGLFTTPLAFGLTAFNGRRRWVDVAVRPQQSQVEYVSLGRTELTATPYALFAKTVTMAGSGTSTAAAHADHDHFGDTFAGDSASAALTISNSGAGIVATGSNAIIGYSTLNGWGAVYGQNNNGYGVVGDANAAAPNSGVLGRNSLGYGVLGQGATGVFGEGSAQGQAGVFSRSPNPGNCTNSSPSAMCYGVIGDASAPGFPGGVGVMGIGTNVGVWGRAAVGSSWAGFFDGKVYVNGLLDAPSGEVKIPSLKPDLNNVRNLGFAGLAWKQVVSYGYPSPSDARLKTDIADLDRGLDDILSLRPVSYRAVDGDGSVALGLIAQDVRAIIPEVVSEDPEGERLLSLDYSRLVPVLIRAIQEQQAEIDLLRSLIEDSR